MATLPLATVRDRLSSLVDDYESIIETLALLNDPVDQERITEAERSVEAGQSTSGDEVGKLVAERLQRARGRIPLR